MKGGTASFTAVVCETRFQKGPNQSETVLVRCEAPLWPPPPLTCVLHRYMVERRWYEQWKEFVETGDQNSSSFPGHIDNTELFDGQLLLRKRQLITLKVV